MTASKRGFATPELLFTIALLTLLVAVALPILGRSRNRHEYRMSCITNLHQIAVAMKLYRQDNGGYPLDLRERPIPPGETWYGNAQNLQEKRRSGYGLGTLFPDYIPNIRTFHCPRTPVKELGQGGDNLAYQSYDGEDPAAGPRGNMVTRVNKQRAAYADTRYFSPRAGLKYARSWRITGQGADTPDPREKRQLVRPDAAAHTVVTWCPYHRRHPHANGVRPTDKDLVVFLDGSAAMVSALDGSGHGAPYK